MYITQDIEQLGVPACSKVQNEKKKNKKQKTPPPQKKKKKKKKKKSEPSDVSAKAHGFSPDEETPVSEQLSSENSKY